MSDRRSHSVCRRAVLIAGASAAVLPEAAQADPGLKALERRLEGGRLGVFALEVGTGRSLAHRADERFATASSFKGLLAGAVLARVDQGHERLNRVLPYSRADLLSHSPVSETFVGKGGLSVETACAAIVQVSDNTAANLLLTSVGGPAGLTAWLRSIGDPSTRLDRYELALNSAIPGDARDTTTPTAIAQTVRKLVFGPVLKPASQARLTGWMQGASTGLKRLRRNLPAGWRAGDKTGTGERGAVCDVAVFWPPRTAPIVCACYTHMGAATLDVREAVMADVGRLVRERLAHG